MIYLVKRIVEIKYSFYQQQGWESKWPPSTANSISSLHFQPSSHGDNQMTLICLSIILFFFTVIEWIQKLQIACFRFTFKDKEHEEMYPSLTGEKKNLSQEHLAQIPWPKPGIMITPRPEYGPILPQIIFSASNLSPQWSLPAVIHPV